MKKNIFLFLLCWGKIAVLLSQSSVWSVTKENHTIFIGGSVHVLREKDFPLPSAFDRAFDRAEKLVFETYVSALSDPSLAGVIMEKSILPEGILLSDVLDPDVYTLLEEKLKEFSIPVSAVEKVKPGALATTLTMLKVLQSGFNADGVDAHYFTKAKKEEKQLGYLEPVDYQINLLTNIGEGYENEYMLYTLYEIDHIEEEIDLLIEDWKTGSFTILQQEIEAMKNEFPSVYIALMKERNDNWLPEIERYIQEKENVFIIVGLAHMCGEDGLLHLLEEKGYKIKQQD